MGKITATGIGSSVGSDDCTAGKAQVLEGYTAVTSDSDDEPVEGHHAEQRRAERHVKMWSE